MNQRAGHQQGASRTGGIAIVIPTAEENDKAIRDFFAAQKRISLERADAAMLAGNALARLCRAMDHKAGQSYKIRALLFSLYNGKPADLSDLLTLDWELRKDMCAVLLAFGFESDRINFFYDAMQSALEDAGLFEWFASDAGLAVSSGDAR